MLFWSEQNKGPIIIQEVKTVILKPQKMLSEDKESNKLPGNVLKKLLLNYVTNKSKVGHLLQSYSAQTLFCAG